VRHAGGVGRKDAALVDHPGGAGIGFAKLLDDLNIGREIDLGTAQGARQRHMEQAGVRQGLEQRSWKLALGFNGGRGGSDLRHEAACDIKQ
jgi:hypothetical protein